MSNTNKIQDAQNAQVVFVVMRYNTIVGVYSKMEDAMQVASLSIAKGQVCDVITRVVQ